jgi:preprotein translocase subunit SecY
VVFLGFVLGFTGIRLVNPSDTGSGSAFAALAAAVVGIGGAMIGQATCFRRGGPRRLAHDDHLPFDFALLVVLAGACGGALWLWLDEGRRSAAAATLALAALGVIPVHTIHERIISTNRHHQGGIILVVLSLVFGIAFVLFVREHAEAGAAIGAAIVAAGGTLYSHAGAIDMPSVSQGGPCS